MCVRVCVSGLMFEMLVLEGYKTAGVFVSFLRGRYLFSLVSGGSAILSEATSVCAYKKRTHTAASRKQEQEII